MLVPSARGQAPVQGKETGSVEGHIRCNDGNVPARRATVLLIPLGNLLRNGESTSPDQKPLGSTTDFDGYYIFPSVPPGIYLVDARSEGYSNDLDLIRLVLDRFTAEQKNQVLSTFPQVLVRGFASTRQDVVLRRDGAITGRVTVDTGGTIGLTNVTATLVSSPLLGGLLPEGRHTPAFSRNGATDDRGNFRIAGLPAGTYRLSVHLTESYFVASVTSQSGNDVTLKPQRPGTAELTVFAPATIESAQAKLVDLREGDEVPDSDITIPLRTLHSIVGTVVQGGNPVSGAVISIQRHGQEVQPLNAISDVNGSFRFDLLPADTYLLQATYPELAGVPKGHGKGQATVVVGDSDVVDAVVQIGSGER
jgi:hypothetical protein